MKWIGQYIWDFVSRFRNTVYLEDLETTTETSALVVDSSGKVSKNVTSGVNMTNGDDNRIVTAVGTNGLQAETYFKFVAEDVYSNLQILDYTGTLGHDYFEIMVEANGATKLITIDQSHALAHFEIEADGDIKLDAAGGIALECGSGDLTCDADTITFTSANDNDPVLILKDTHSGANCARLNFVKDKGANGGADDLVGSILFTGDNAAQEQTNFTLISTKVAVETDTNEAGEFLIEVASSNGSASALLEGLKITGTASTQLLNVEIGHGASSMTTIAGDLRVTTHLSATRSYGIPDTDVGSHTGGDVYFYGSGSTVKGSIYYMNSSGSWTLADADAESTASGLLAVALGTDPNNHGMLFRGFVTLLTEIEGTEAVGSTLYLSATDGGVATITQPSGPGDIVRVIGYSLHASNNQVYFNPSGTFVEIS